MCCGLFSLAQLWQCYHLGLLFEAGPGLKRTQSKPPAHKWCMCNRTVQSASVSVSLWDLLLWLLFNYQSGTSNIFWLTTCVYALQLDYLITKHTSSRNCCKGTPGYIVQNIYSINSTVCKREKKESSIQIFIQSEMSKLWYFHTMG